MKLNLLKFLELCDVKQLALWQQQLNSEDEVYLLKNVFNGRESCLQLAWATRPLQLFAYMCGHGTKFCLFSHHFL